MQMVTIGTCVGYREVWNESQVLQNRLGIGTRPGT